MSNYFISKCCGAEARFISSSGVGVTIGRCTDCLEVSSLEVVVDEQEFKEKADNNDLTI